jgi:phytoene synthase
MTASARQALVDEAGRIIAQGSKSFRFASQIFDEETRGRSWLLYAWCRACDDITDGQTLGHDAVTPHDPAERIAFLRTKTADALAGKPTGLAAFDAFSAVAAECAIPARLAADHLAGFERDAAGWAPATEDELLSYCFQVAGAVGVMMAFVMGVPASKADTLDRAADLGIAFQLANISRDIVDDAKVGRRYLPDSWLSEEGLTGADLTDSAHRPALARIAQRFATLADRYRKSAKVGAACLPFRSRWAVNSAARIYGTVAIRAVELGERAWDQRISIPRREKFWLVLMALGDSLRAPRNVSREGLWTAP